MSEWSEKAVAVLRAVVEVEWVVIDAHIDAQCPWCGAAGQFSFRAHGPTTITGKHEPLCPRDLARALVAEYERVSAA